MKNRHSILICPVTNMFLTGSHMDGALSGKGCYEARIACHLMSGKGTFKYEKSFDKVEQMEKNSTGNL